MNQSKNYPTWFLNLWEHGPQIIIIGLIVLGAFIAVSWFVEYRLAAIEERLSYRPPETYAAPDLKSMAASDAAEPSHWETVYVPIYSHVYHQGGSPFLLEATLSIRNIDPLHEVYIGSVRYYDTEGELSKTHVTDPIRLGPMQTIEFLVEQQDTSGGSGANFLIDWSATEAAQTPLFEAVMVGNLGTQAIGFVSRGVPLEDRN